MGSSPLPREGVDVGERRLPGVECVWPVGKVVSRWLVTFLIDSAPSKEARGSAFLPLAKREGGPELSQGVPRIVTEPFTLRHRGAAVSTTMVDVVPVSVP